MNRVTIRDMLGSFYTLTGSTQMLVKNKNDILVFHARHRKKKD